MAVHKVAVPAVLSGRGITLVEVIVSVALVTLVTASVVTVVSQSVVDSRRLDRIYASSLLAKKRIDDLKTMNFRDLADSAVESNVRIDGFGEPDVSGEFVRTTEVVTSYAGNPYLTKVKVSVDKMMSGSASGRSVVMETLFSDVE